MTSPVLDVRPLDFVWDTTDPFLFCVHHADRYPRGNAVLGPDPALLRGRAIGQDFELRDGFRMYHGQAVPGFPQHPHRGFETVTIVRRGLIDHSDSLGAAARFGDGDVQWLTAGAGILHSEMFPLLKPDAENPLELFQLWLNLPSADKHAPPHFSMLWSEQLPRVEREGAELTVIAGAFGDLAPLPLPPRSYAARPESDLAIWLVKLQPGARLVLPPAQAGTRRRLYLFDGAALHVGAHLQSEPAALQVACDAPVELRAGATACELLVLQGRPIGESVVQYGPFVMNTREEIQQAFQDYRRTQFGGWPWPSDEPVHGATEGRFARRPDGEVERPPA